jgi:hypothetical protein
VVVREIQRKKEKRETHRKEAKYDCFNEKDEHLLKTLE